MTADNRQLTGKGKRKRPNTENTEDAEATERKNCHSERSRPIFSSAFAPANASACAAEESLCNSVLV
ncbi:hypothetical protein AUG19_05300 [archaeon 13_1_20CM_2_54_9]|nr:MAG: hypothetical protein AUG19_05300 [archaeon 13_1_20CM_2_54_9]